VSLVVSVLQPRAGLGQEPTSGDTDLRIVECGRVIGSLVAVEPPKLIVMLVYGIASVRLRTR
jgi:hypothetical protein